MTDKTKARGRSLLFCSVALLGVICGGGGAIVDAAAATPAGVNLTNHGAVCDGVADNSAAIAHGLADAKAQNLPLVIPVGQCNFSQVIRMDGVKLAGSGASSVLYATNWHAGAIFLTGAGSSITNVKLTGPAAPSRVPYWEATKIVAFGTDFVVDHVTIEGPTGGPVTSGILAMGAARGRITNNTIRNTLADSIHITGGSSFITVENNFIENAGDDGIAVVSYQHDRVRVHDITARNNVIRNNVSGRNMSVLGGTNVLYENNLLQGNPDWACMYLAQENSWATYSVLNVTVRNNTFQNCGSNYTGHGAVMLFSDGTEANNNVTLQNNDIIQDGRDGITYFGPQTNIKLQDNRITGARNAYVARDASTGVTVTKYTSGSAGHVAP